MRKIRHREFGATSVEYALLVGLVAVGIISSAVVLKGKMAGALDGNVASMGTPSLSSTMGYFTADKAIDGEYSIEYAPPYKGMMAHSNGNVEEWWQDDLGQNFKVTKIRFFPRADCCTTRQNGAYLMLSKTPFPATLSAALGDSSIARVQMSVPDANPITLTFEGEGRYFRLWQATDWVQVPEIEIYGGATGTS